MDSNNINDYHRSDSLWQNHSSYDINSKILLVTIVSFSIIILMVFVYHLYSRFVLRYRRSSTFDQDLSLAAAVSQPPKRGLDVLLIASLPTFIVGVNRDDVAVATECVVCLSLLEEKVTARMLPNCKHVFHVTCVDMWLATHSTCPVCRSEVEPRPRIEPEPREGPVGDVASSSDNKTSGSSVLRLDSFRRILTRERSLNKNDRSCVDQGGVLDIERQ